jgi:serine/threonine-protein kinase RsbW
MSEKMTNRSSPAKARSMQFCIPSAFDDSRKVQEQIMAEVERVGFDEAARFAIQLGLEEAIVNAIKHGNKLDASKRVRVEAEITPQQARIVIEDEGPGFNRRSVPDPRCDENLEKCCGRGILLIEAYMTQVYWSNQGRRLTMIRDNDAEGPHLRCS